MARKPRQSAKPVFASLRPTPSITEQSADTFPSPFTFPSLAALLTPNTRLIHAHCAEATRPSDEELVRVRVGDQVKVKFVAPLGNERMWVTVTARTTDDFTGILDNMPQLIADLKWGDTVTFTAQEIAALNP